MRRAIPVGKKNRVEQMLAEGREWLEEYRKTHTPDELSAMYSRCFERTLSLFDICDSGELTEAIARMEIEQHQNLVPSLAAAIEIGRRGGPDAFERPARVNLQIVGDLARLDFALKPVSPRMPLM